MTAYRTALGCCGSSRRLFGRDTAHNCAPSGRLSLVADVYGRREVRIITGAASAGVPDCQAPYPLLADVRMPRVVCAHVGSPSEQ